MSIHALVRVSTKPRLPDVAWLAAALVLGHHATAQVSAAGGRPLATPSVDAPCVAPAYPEEVLDRGLFDSAIAADLNGDGLPDLVVSGPRVHLAESPSGYAAAQDLGGAYLGHVVALDLDGDGDLDLAGTASPDPASPFVIVHLNDGSGSFPASSTFLLPGIGEALVAADLNGDGLPDLACTLPDSDEVAVLLGSSGGGFLAASTYAAGTDPEHLVRGDLDGDGLDDLVVTTAGGEVAVLLNTGGGTFPTRVPYSVGPDLRGVEAADLDDDGDLDLVVASYGSMDLFVLENAGDGSFPLLHPMGLAARPLNVAVGDLYQNGRADVVLGVPGPPALDTYEVWVLEKLGPGIMDFAAARKRIVQSQPWSLSVVDLEGDDDLDLLVRNAPRAGGEVFRILNHGQGSLQVADVYALQRRLEALLDRFLASMTSPGYFATSQLPEALIAFMVTSEILCEFETAQIAAYDRGLQALAR